MVIQVHVLKVYEYILKQLCMVSLWYIGYLTMGRSYFFWGEQFTMSEEQQGNG